MLRKINHVLILILSFVLIVSTASIAGGGGKGGGGSSEPEPQYYSLEDLRRALSYQRFYFANENKPTEALVNLGYFPVCAASTDKKYSIVSMVSSNPAQYGVNSFKISSNWNDSNIIVFDWNKFKSLGGMKCDLIFTRGTGIGAEVVKRFSNWTHVAIVNDVDDKSVFESTPDTGVRVNKTTDTWKDITYFTCKRIKRENNPQRPLTYGELEYALQRAKSEYGDKKPYIPSVSTVFDIIGGYLLKWCDKNNMESIYCSKLVYITFKDLVNFDTNRTKVDNAVLKEGAWAAPMFSWIGISPDDIYFSNMLDYDFSYSDNVLYL
jgi:hypothetical protein